MAPAEAHLCFECGLCCDGSLFADVMLQTAELESIEQQVGYEYRDGNPFLQQPCLAYRQGRCQVYENRPQGCRSYECQVLCDLKEGRIKRPEAGQQIHQLRAIIEIINRCLAILGETDLTLPLSHRIESAMGQAWDLNEPQEKQEAREELQQIVPEFESLAGERFRAVDIP